MAVCKTCKCEPKYCGCADKAIPTGPFCGSLSCPDPEPCAETFSAHCIVYTGNSIPELGIMKGDRVDDIIQRLVTYLLNPDCVAPFSDFNNQVANTCLAVVDLHVQSISTTQAVLGWTSPAYATSYDVSYGVVPDVGDPIVWITTSTPVINSFTISGLTSNTSYYFKISSYCDAGGPCDSIVIQANTLNS